jgi:regulation of enolase protein 1 (concanavalin A-like superfamily)
MAIAGQHSRRTDRLLGSEEAIRRRMAVTDSRGKSAPMQEIQGVPGTFRWLGAPASADLAAGVLSMRAGPRTDWFTDPGTGEVTVSAPAFVASLPGDFRLAARVQVDFASTFDAGALVLWQDERRWAKLAFERSPQGQPMVVSVVTRGESDDCNSVPVDADAIWLRVSSLGAAHAFHASADGQTWEFVRHFRLGATQTPLAGFEVQSPSGDGCAAQFASISYTPGPLPDLRSGA